MKPAPLPPDEARRLDALREYAVLDTPPELEFDDLTALAAQICGTPIALISLVDGQRQWFKSKVGLTSQWTSRDEAFCAHALHSPALLLVPDAALDERFADNPSVTGDPHIRFYAGAPLLTPTGHALGTLCVIDRVPRQLSAQQQSALQTLSRQVMVQLQLRRHARDMAGTKASLLASEHQLRELAQRSDAERARLAAAQAVAKMGSWETNLATMQVIWSEETHRIFETNPATFHPSHEAFLQLVHPADRAAVTAAFDSSLGQLSPCQIEHRLLLTDGHLKIVEECWQVFRDEKDQPVRTVGTCRDITERSLAEGKLRQAQGMARIAGRLGKIGDWSIELPGQELTWSDEVCLIHDLPPGYKPTYAEGLSYFLPEHRAEVIRCVEACTLQGTPYDLELPKITVKGRPIWVRSTGEAVRDNEGRIIRIQGAFQDLTERKQAAEAIRELAERLSNTLESLTDGFFTLDRNWCFTYLNREAERMFRMQRTELLGQHIWAKFPEARDTISQHEYERAMRDNVAVQFDTFYPPLNTRFDARAFPSPHGLAVYFRDVTASRRAEDALRASEQRFRLLAKATNDAIWDWDLLTDSLWWNEGYEKLFGYRPDETDPSIKSWTNHLHPEDLARITDGIHHVIDHGGDFWTNEYRFRCRDGSFAYVLDRGHILRDSAGKAVRMIGRMTDLTERKRAEQEIAQQAALIDKAQDGIIVHDLHHRIKSWSRGAERLYGWTAAEAVDHPMEVLLKIDRATFDQADRVVREKGDWNGEILKTTKNGAVLTVHARWNLLRNDKGRPVSILTIDTDITERKALEAQFLRAQRMESIGTLASGIAHDLNNVLAPILMSIALLKLKMPDNEKVQRQLDQLGANTERGAKLVRHLLTFGRGFTSERISLQPKHIAREVAQLVEDTFPKGIEFHFTFDPDLWSMVGDPTQLHQILLNLCVNARDAMPQGGRLSLHLANAIVEEASSAMQLEFKPGRYVLLTVTDSGTGIPAAIREKIFDPFFTTKEEGKGTGLGLSTTLALVRSHAGFLELHSEEGKGTTFKIYLPASTTDVPAVLIEETPRLEGRNELILVVDDEPVIREVARRILERFGYRVLLAENGIEAVSHYSLNRGKISLVILDMAMPIMGGPATILALRSINPTVRIITSSGQGAEAAMTETGAVGASITHFMPKPYTAEDLLQAIREAIGQGSRPPMPAKAR